MAPPIPITVLGGYLGAGKTTLLNAVLAANAGRRLAVVVNDFGELGIDAALLAAGAADDGVIDLPNGCICCTLGNDLADVLDTLSSRTPRLDHIVVEASGVADPTTLAAWGTVPGFAPGGVFVLAAADAIDRLVDDRYVGGEVRRQLEAADLVVVTKADLVDPSRLTTVRDLLSSCTTAPVVVADDATPGLVLAARVEPTRAASVAARSEGGHGVSYAGWTWQPDPERPACSLGSLRRFVDELPPTVLRAKGIVPVVAPAPDQAGDGLAEDRHHRAERGPGDRGGIRPTQALVQVVGRSRSITPLAEIGPTAGLVVIGVSPMDLDALDALAEAHLQVSRSRIDTMPTRPVLER